MVYIDVAENQHAVYLPTRLAPDENEQENRLPGILSY